MSVRFVPIRGTVGRSDIGKFPHPNVFDGSRLNNNQLMSACDMLSNTVQQVGLDRKTETWAQTNTLTGRQLIFTDHVSCSGWDFRGIRDSDFAGVLSTVNSLV